MCARASTGVICNISRMKWRKRAKKGVRAKFRERQREPGESESGKKGKIKLSKINVRRDCVFGARGSFNRIFISSRRGGRGNSRILSSPRIKTKDVRRNTIHLNIISSLIAPRAGVPFSSRAGPSPHPSARFSTARLVYEYLMMWN